MSKVVIMLLLLYSLIERGGFLDSIVIPDTAFHGPHIRSYSNSSELWSLCMETAPRQRKLGLCLEIPSIGLVGEEWTTWCILSVLYIGISVRGDAADVVCKGMMQNHQLRLYG